MHDAQTNNPAGRVRAFLKALEKRARTSRGDPAILHAAKLLGVPPESPRAYLIPTQLRIQVEMVPDLIEERRHTRGYATFTRYYPEIVDLAKRFQGHPEQSLTILFAQEITEGAWFSLDHATKVLARDSEVDLSDEALSDLVSQVRDLIEDVIADRSLSTDDKRDIANLLRKVETTLMDVRLTGPGPVVEAAAAAGAIVRTNPDLWDRVMHKTWVKRLFILAGGLALTLQGVDSGIAVEQYVRRMIEP